MLHRLVNKLAKLASPSREPEAPSPMIRNAFIAAAPHPQNALNIFKGEWMIRMPEGLGLIAGNFPGDHYNDQRVLAADRIFGLRGASVLELGPCEAHHTTMLTQRGAKVTAVESNTRAYLKCLVIKEIFRLDATFLLGNAVAYMQNTSERFDIVFASGFLYHQPEPEAALAAMARVSDRLFVQTHYFDEAAIAASNMAGRFTARRSPYGITYHNMPYENRDSPVFLGGIADATNWIGKDDMLRIVRELGFRVDIVADDTTPNGPSISFAAVRA